MKSKVIILIGLAFVMGGQAAHAQGLKDKIKSSVKKDGGKKQKTGANNFTHLDGVDNGLGITGSYKLLNGEEYKKPGAYTMTKISFYGLEYMKEEGGNVVNKLNVWYGKKEGDKIELKLHESWKNKHNELVFYKWKTASDYVELIKIDEGVFAEATVSSTMNKNTVAPASWQRKVTNVIANDPAQLETYDIETAQAKLDMITVKFKAELVEKNRKALLSYKAYTDYQGKCAFSNKLSTFNYRSFDKPTEDPKNFIKEAELGGELYFRAYMDEPMEIAAPGAWFNYSYELKGKTTDREELRSQSSYFSKNIPRKDGHQKYFTTYVKSLIEKGGNGDIWDIAFIELLYQNKDVFKVGESYELIVHVHAYKDGENVKEVATGKIMLKYTEESKKLMDNTDQYNLGIIQRYEMQKDE